MSNIEVAPSKAQPRHTALISSDYAARLESARASQAMVGERRVVTILFCDMIGSTAAAEKLDPEGWAEIVNQLFELMIGPVYQYEGTVGRLMGDAILAFFGAPIAHEDDPRRAILAGLDIIAAIQPFREKARQEWGIDINVRVGINTGLVMVGQVGSDLRMEYTAMGDAINVASRMEQTAEPGTVQVSQETFSYIAPFFEYVDLGEQAVKGKSTPIHTYRPLRRKSRTDWRRGIEVTDAPLVGRAGELAMLIKALEEARSGVGGIVCLIGEAGIGKSRLIREAAARLEITPTDDASSVAWYETVSQSYEAARPYALFQRLLRIFWGISIVDDAPAIREKLAAGHTEDSNEQEIFQILLGAGSEPGLSSREGESYKKDLYRAITDLATRESADRPLIIVFDDLHWADPASVELVIHLMSLVERQPLLLICAMRPDREAPGWQVKQTAEKTFAHRYQEIGLDALTAEESSALVDSFLNATNLTPASRQRILNKTDGNPFFVEEVVRMLIEQGLIVPDAKDNGPGWRLVQEIDDAQMPGSLQSMLVARIDRLEESSRRTIQLASVIGRSFYYRILDAIYDSVLPSEIDLDAELILLQRRDLIRQSAVLPEPEYMFRQALAQEAAYSTMLLRQRRKFHRLAGDAIEELFAEQLDEHYAILAYHFSRADDPRSVRYAQLAADNAYRLFAIPEALRHYTLALETLDEKSYDETWIDDADSPTDTLIHLFRRRGRCLELRSEYHAAQDNYAAMENLARQQDNAPMLLAALMARATNYAIPSGAHDRDSAQELAEEALGLARQLNDQPAEARVLWIFMLIRMYSYSMADGIPFGEQSAALARKLDMNEQLAQSLQDLSRCYITAERFKEALEVLIEARPLWESLRNLPMLAENLGVEAQIRVMTAEFDQAVDAAEQCLSIAESIDNVWGQATARSFVPLVPIARGEINQALKDIQTLITDAEQARHPARILGWFYMAWMYSQLGAAEQAAHATQKCLESASDFAPLKTIGLAMLAWLSLQAGDMKTAGRLLNEAGHAGEQRTIFINDLVLDLAQCADTIARQDYQQAEKSIDDLVLRLRDSGVRYFLPYALQLKSQLHKGMGQSDLSGQSLEEALRAAEETQNRLLTWRLYAELGDETTATNVARTISGNIAEPTLRERFLAFSRDKIRQHAAL